MGNLTSAKDFCNCNDTTCGCCVSNQIITAVTERQCAVNELRSTCQSCTPIFNSTQVACSGCNTTDLAYQVFNVSYPSVDPANCLCRNDNATSNCTCCQKTRPAGPVAPVCPANASELLPNCACAVVNGTYKCDCVRSANGVDTFYNKINGTNCSCQNVARPNGQQPLQCQCCSSADQLATPAPVCPSNSSDFSVEKCLCSGDACDCKYKSTGVTVKNVRASNCSCPNNTADKKDCGCCVNVQQYRDAQTPSCQPSDPLATCACANVTQVVNKVSTTSQKCNCTVPLKSETGATVFNTQNVLVAPSQCGSYVDGSSTVFKCCVKESTMTQIPTRTCANLMNATCTFAAGNATSREGVCQARTANATFFLDSVRVNMADCSCLDYVKNGVAQQRCNCCLNKTLANATLVVKAPAVCNTTTASVQNCDCKSVFDTSSNTYKQSCDCSRRVGTQLLTRQAVAIDKSQCVCLNSTADGKQNVASCQCCVENPPLTKCELLARNMSQNLRCSCSDVVVNGKAQNVCDCSSVINATTTLTKLGMAGFDESQCCWVEKTDPITRKGFRSCNCTQAAVPQTQNCACKASSAKNSTTITCACTDCNNQVTANVKVPAAQCKCPAAFYNASSGSLMNNGNQGKAENTTTNGTKSNSTTNSSTAANTTVSTNTTSSNSTSNTSVSTNTTKSNATTNATTNGTVVVVNTTTNATTNGTKSNVTTSTNVTTNGTANATTNATSNATSSTNGTKTNGTNSTSGSNVTVSANSTNATSTNGTNVTTPTSNATNTTKPNSTVSGNTTNATNATTGSTANTTTPVQKDADVFSCNCEVPFQGFCPALNPSAPVSEGSCDASNIPKQLRASGSNAVSTVNAGCKYQYEYLVAVIATNKDSSLLMQLQSYQNAAMSSASYLSSFASLFVLVASVFLFY